jgi:hypothetical protein
MKKVLFVFMIFITSIFADNTDNETTDDHKKLEYALTKSQTFERNLTSQVGLSSMYSYQPRHTNIFFVPLGSNIHFSGIEKLDYAFKPKYESIENDSESPAFMLMFKKRGDNLSISGGVKGVDIDNLNKYLNEGRE